MECPRCGGELTVYRLGGESSWVCRECGSVGVETEHGSEPARTETWEQAIQRFYAQHAGPDDGESASPDDGELTDRNDPATDETDGTALEASQRAETAATALDDLEIPGDGELRRRRRETVAELYAFLRERETASRSDFLELVDPEEVSYASPEGFWEAVGRDGLRKLPGVTPPESGHHEWAFENGKSEGQSDC